jgi:hypothetical protein
MDQVEKSKAKVNGRQHGTLQTPLVVRPELPKQQEGSLFSRVIIPALVAIVVSGCLTLIVLYLLR